MVPETENQDENLADVAAAVERNASVPSSRFCSITLDGSGTIPRPRRRRRVRRARNRARQWGPRVERRGTFYWITGTYLGIRIRQSTGEIDRKEAEDFLLRRLEEVKALRRGEQPTPLVRAGYPRAVSPLPTSPRRQGYRLIQRNGIFWITGSYRGVRCRKTTHERDELRALKVLVREEDAVRDRLLNPRPVKRTLFEACTAYLNHQLRSEETKCCVLKIRDAVPEALLCEDVNDDVLISLRHHLCRATSLDSTYKRQVIVPMKAILTWAAAKWGAVQGCLKPQMMEVPDGKPRAVILLPRHACILTAEASRRGWFSVCEVLEVGLCEGLRLAEFVNLKWSDIDIDDAFMRLASTKAKPGQVRNRDIHDLRPRTIMALRRIKERTGATSGSVFLDDSARPYSSKDAFGRILNARLRALRSDLNLRDSFSLHNLRHTAASWHYAQSPDLERIRTRMDWLSLASAARYVKLLPEHMAPEVADFWMTGTNLPRSEATRKK